MPTQTDRTSPGRSANNQSHYSGHSHITRNEGRASQPPGQNRDNERGREDQGRFENKNEGGNYRTQDLPGSSGTQDPDLYGRSRNDGYRNPGASKDQPNDNRGRIENEGRRPEQRGNDYSVNDEQNRFENEGGHSRDQRNDYGRSEQQGQNRRARDERSRAESDRDYSHGHRSSAPNSKSQNQGDRGGV